LVAGSIPIGALFGESARFFFADCHFYSHTVGYGAGAGFVLFFLQWKYRPIETPSAFFRNASSMDHVSC
jgi:hypothetical protein